MTVPPYLDLHLPGLMVESIHTVGVGSLPKTGDGTMQLVGITDGIGVIDGSELNPALCCLASETEL